VDSLSGQRRIGEDVRAEKHREMMANALRPLLGESAEQYEKRHRRFPLSPAAKTRCAQLDSEIPRTEILEQQLSEPRSSEVRTRLFHLRGEFRGLKC
jgi:hypothetical protein